MTNHDDWLRANQRYLVAYLESLRLKLEMQMKKGSGSLESKGKLKEMEALITEITQDMVPPPALESLSNTFGLSKFEMDVLMLCAGIEMDGRFAPMCAELNGSAAENYPTFNLALSYIPGAHWSAVIGSGPLRRWRMIELGNGVASNMSILKIDASVLDYLVGMKDLDVRLEGTVEPVEGMHEVPPSMMGTVDRASMILTGSFQRSDTEVLELCGGDEQDRRALAFSICGKVGLNLFTMRPGLLPAQLSDLKETSLLWEREALLGGSCLLIECGGGDAERRNSAGLLAERLRTPTLISSDRPVQINGRKVMVLEVGSPTIEERKDCWLRTLGPENAALADQVDAVVAQFDLSLSDIASIAEEARTTIALSQGKATEGHERILWDACRKRVRSRFDNLARRIDPKASWEDLVLPEQHVRSLRSMASHVRQRSKVIDEWGFGSKSSRGLGTSALFAGPSGTGKTMAAEVLANELGLDLYRIDLSQVVSKYIGETEKNLEKVFSCADASGAILLFDEADALFGKRSEVKDSHDRYANIEVGYLLQRMEDYRGLAILTTNMKSAIDPAFLRRIRFVIDFPFPDEKARARIWQAEFPSSTPLEGLDFASLAKMNVSGGSIHNIALNAAYLAADEGRAVRTEHVLDAARTEYAKLEKTISAAELGVSHATKQG